jgi:ElaB/YqjD/DUF883 family membrane-anchored ribosome-binding protein
LLRHEVSVNTVGTAARRGELEPLPIDSRCLQGAVGTLEAKMAEARAASTPRALDSSERDVKQDFDSLRADLDTLRKDFSSLVSTLKDNVSGRAETFARDLQTTGQEQLRSAERKIEEQPLMSVAIAFVTGLVVGRLLDRR